MARFAKRMGIPLPMLVGQLSLAEWDAAQVVNDEEWTFTDQLLVAVVERIDLLRYIVHSALTKEGSGVPKPLHIPRPGEDTSPQKVKPSDLARMLGG